MAKYSLPFFGKIDPASLEEDYDATIDFNKEEVELLLHFDGSTIDTTRLDLVKAFLERLPDQDIRNRAYIKNDYEDEEADTVRTYLEHHLEEIDREAFSGLINFDDEVTNPELQLMKALHLVRVSLYPDNDEQFATFDYSIDPEITQYLVVIITDAEGNLDYMTMES